MKLSSDCKNVLDVLHVLKPNNGVRFYTLEYVFHNVGNSLSPDALLAVLDTLASAEAIVWGDKQHTAFALTELGRSYKEIDHLERKERWKERFYGFVFGVLTTVIAAVILKLILQ